MVNIGPVLRKGRAKTEQRMRATAVVTRRDGMELDDDGYEVPSVRQVYPDPSWPDDHPYVQGKCYFRYPGLAFETDYDSAGLTITQTRMVGRFPFSVEFKVGDVVTIVSDPDNPHLDGSELRVGSIDDQSQATAQRLLLDNNQRGVDEFEETRVEGS